MFYKMIVCCICLVSSVSASEGQWEKSADLSFNLNQSSYNDAWAGGETGSIVWTAIGNLAAEKAFNDRYNLRNTLKLSFGQTHSQADGDDGQKHWESPEKSTDRIFAESLLRLTLQKFVDPYAAITVESQFYDASVKEITRYLSPLTISEAAGVGRLIMKNENTELLSRVGFAFRQHFTKDIVTINPEETETNTTQDGGLEWVTDFNHKFDDVKYVSKLRLFKAAFNSESDTVKGTEAEDYWKEVDVAWENTLSASVSKYVQVSLFCELLYDKEIDLRGRFREVLGIGVTYKLF